MSYTIQDIKKTNKGFNRSFIGTYFYRHVAVYFTYFLAMLPLTANQVSFLSLFVGLFSAFLFASGDFKLTIVAALLAQIAMILDYSDGQIARLKKLGSNRGAWLDVVLGMIQNNLIILGIILGLIVHVHSLFPWIVGFIALFAWNMTCYVHLIAMIFFPSTSLQETKLGKSLQKGFKIHPEYFAINSDVYYVVITIAAIIGYLLPGLLILGILGNLYWIAAGTYIFLYSSKA